MFDILHVIIWCSLIFVFLLLLGTLILNSAQVIKESVQDLSIEKIVELNFLLGLVIVKEDLEKFENLNFDPLLEGEEKMRSQSFYEGIALAALVLA